MRDLPNVNQQLVTSLLYLGLDADPALQESSDSDALTTAKADGYRPISRIGIGGFSDIWAGVQLKTRKDYALKTIRSDLTSKPASRAASMLAAESEFLKRVDSPRVVGYHGMGGEGASQYIVLEYLPGDNLHRITELGTHTIDTLIDLADELIQTLAVVHGERIAHGAIKPGNFVLRDEKMPVLIDFGMACDLDQPLLSAFIRLNKRGTRRYMAPELIDGRAQHPTTQSDVYSLCLVILELLSSSVEDVSIPRRINKVLDAGLSADPGARPSNASELLADFRKARAGRRLQAPMMLTAASIVAGAAIFLTSFPGSDSQDIGPGQPNLAAPHAMLPAVRWENEHHLLLYGDHSQAADALQGAAASEQTWAWKLLDQWAETGVQPLLEHRFGEMPGTLSWLSPTGSTAAYVDSDRGLWVWRKDGQPEQVATLFDTPRSVAPTCYGDQVFVTGHDHWLVQYVRTAGGWEERPIETEAEVSFARLPQPGDPTSLHVQLMGPTRYQLLSKEAEDAQFARTAPVPNDGLIHGGDSKSVGLLTGEGLQRLQVLLDGLPVKDVWLSEKMKTPLSIAYIAKQDLLACGTREGQVWACGSDGVWREVVDLPTEAPVLDLALDRSGGLVFVAARKLYVVDMNSGRILLVLGDDFEAEFVADLAWNEEQQELTAATTTRILRWSVDTDQGSR